MTNKSRTIFRSVRLFGSGRDARTRGRFQRVVSGDATLRPTFLSALGSGQFAKQKPTEGEQALYLVCNVKTAMEALAKQIER